MESLSKKDSAGIIGHAYFGSGCFWCSEATFSRLRGVLSVTPGYAGGKSSGSQLPTYEEVCTGKTGHAEIVKIEFDPKIISYETLLNVFFALHDPTTLNRQGMDVGTQYRSIILFADEEQKEMAEKFIRDLEKDKVFANPIVTEVKPLEAFYEAEEYHKNYFEKHPEAAYCQAVISPKVAKLREKFKGLLK